MDLIGLITLISGNAANLGTGLGTGVGNFIGNSANPLLSGLLGQNTNKTETNSQTVKPKDNTTLYIVVGVVFVVLVIGTFIFLKRKKD